MAASRRPRTLRPASYNALWVENMVTTRWAHKAVEQLFAGVSVLDRGALPPSRRIRERLLRTTGKGWLSIVSGDAAIGSSGDLVTSLTQSMDRKLALGFFGADVAAGETLAPDSPWTRLLTWAAFVGARGPESAARLSAVGLQDVAVIGDPLLALGHSLGGKRPNTVGVSIRADGPDVSPWVEALLATGARVMLWPLSEPDLARSRQLARTLNCAVFEGYASFYETIRWLGGLRHVFAQRSAALVLAHACETPGTPIFIDDAIQDHCGAVGLAPEVPAPDTVGDVMTDYDLASVSAAVDTLRTRQRLAAQRLMARVRMRSGRVRDLRPHARVKVPRDRGAPGPIFIVGMPRSGTTVLTRLFGSHSTLAMGPETHFLDWLGRTRARDFESVLDQFVRRQHFLDLGITPEELRAAVTYETDNPPREIFNGAMRAFAARHGKPRWGEKTPQHWEHVPRLLRWFPDARVIWMVRDPRAVMASRQKVPWGGADFVGQARAWARCWEAATGLLGDDRVRTCFYEELVEAPERELRALCGFVGLDFEPSMLDSDSRAKADTSVWGLSHHRRAAQRVSGAGSGKWVMQLDSQQLGAVEAAIRGAMWTAGYLPCLDASVAGSRTLLLESAVVHELRRLRLTVLKLL